MFAAPDPRTDKALTRIGMSQSQKNVMHAISTPWMTFGRDTAPSYPIGPNLGVPVHETLSATFGKPPGFAAGPWGFVGVELNIVVSARDGEVPNPLGVVNPTYAAAYEAATNITAGRLCGTALPPTPAGAAGQSINFQNAVYAIILFEGSNYPDWGTLGSVDAADVVLMQSGFMTGDNVLLMGGATKIVSVGPELSSSGSFVAFQQDAYPRDMSFNVEALVASLDNTTTTTRAGYERLVLTMPPPPNSPSEASNLVSQAGRAIDGVLQVFPSSLTRKTLGVNVDGLSTCLGLFSPVASAVVGPSDTYQFISTPGIYPPLATAAAPQGQGAASYYSRSYVRLAEIGTSRVGVFFTGLDDSDVFTVTTTVQGLRIPSGSDDGWLAASFRQDARDIPFAQTVDETTKMLPPGMSPGANGFGWLHKAIGGIASVASEVVGRTSKVVKAVAPAAEKALGMAAQMPGPIGRRAQMAEMALDAAGLKKPDHSDTPHPRRKTNSSEAASFSPVPRQSGTSQRSVRHGSAVTNMVANTTTRSDGRGGEIIHIRK
jgi:hypothetical protein